MTNTEYLKQRVYINEMYMGLALLELEKNNPTKAKQHLTKCARKLEELDSKVLELKTA